MKKRIVFAIIVILFVALCLLQFTPIANRVCGSKDVRLITERSGFYDFTIADGCVYYRCKLVIENLTNKEIKFSVYAFQPLEFLLGYVKSPVFKSVDTEGKERVYHVIPHGKITISVAPAAVRGWNGSYAKFDKNLPNIVIVGR